MNTNLRATRNAGIKDKTKYALIFLEKVALVGAGQNQGEHQHILADWCV
jgi:hypothetical protein